MARAALKANLNGAKDGYRSRPAAALRRVPGRHSSPQSSHGLISERHQFSQQQQAAVRFAIGLVQGKWKIGILCRLQEGPARLGDLRRLFPRASKKMLTQHLRQMERDGLIVRSDLSGRVPLVQYSLLEPRGVAISRLLDCLSIWGAEYLLERAPNSSDVIGRWLAESKSAKCNSEPKSNIPPSFRVIQHSKE